MSGKVAASDEPAETPPLDEERLLRLEPYEILDTPVLRHQYRFLENSTDAAGDYLRAEFRLESDSISLDKHLHLQQEETFKVLSGELHIEIEGKQHTLVAGDEMTLPAGVPHYHGNGGRCRDTRSLRDPSTNGPRSRLPGTFDTRARGKTQRQRGKLAGIRRFPERKP